MDKEKEITISEVVFPIIKGQFISCTKTKCNHCYENSKGSCSSAATANEIEVALINAGYGNVKQAVKEFAEKVKRIIYKSDCEEPVCWKIEDKIDNLITELYGKLGGKQ